jgi:hypothetical protein
VRVGYTEVKEEKGKGNGKEEGGKGEWRKGTMERDGR